MFHETNLNCNTPIITSGIEWCTNPYLYLKKYIDKCPDKDFFSGFYNDDIDSIKYGVFRNLKELKQVLTYIDEKNKSGEEVPLYKNIIENKNPNEYFRGGYYKKYIKYKNKYLTLKNT